MSNKRERVREYKKELVLTLLKELDDKNLTLNYVVDRMKNVKYSNAYNFLYKEKYSDLSFEKSVSLLTFVRDINV
jgi:hypothetical protein